MIDEQEDLADYEHRFFAKLAALVAPYATVLFLFQRPSGCSPRPRLVATLTSGHCLDLQFKTTTKLQVLRGLGLPKVLKRLILLGTLLQAPIVDVSKSPEAAAELCWVALSDVCQAPTVCPAALPPLPPDQQAQVLWLESRASALDSAKSSARKALANPVKLSTPRRFRA